MAKKSINAVIGEKIKELRKDNGMSQMKLANALGISYQQVQKYEKATGSIAVDRLEQIAKAFKISITEFFPAETEKSKKPVKKSKK